jgi:serine phosphatase RsbU (regulator of sigma subunit)
MKSQKIKEELEDNQGIALACIQIGNLYLSKKSPQEAKKYFHLSREIADQIGAKYEMKDANMGLSNTYSYLNLYDSAYYYLNEYNKVYQDLLSEEASKKLAELEASLASQRREEQIAAERKIEALTRNIMIISGIAIILILVGFSFMMFNRYKLKKKANDQLEKYNVEILKQKDIIEAKNRDIMDSIKYAKRIQEAILPSNEVLSNCLHDFFVFYRPKDIVSGDFYWAHPLGEKKILFAAVDCTGHGVPGAFVSIVGFNGLNSAVKEFGLTQPAKILDELNILVDETFITHGSSNIKDGMDINLCLLEYLPDGKARIEFAAANNPLWILRKTNPVTFEEVKADMQPIGAFFNRKPFTNHEITLNPGDCFYIFSDGYADQFGGDKGKKFKYKKFRDMLTDMNHLSMEEQRVVIQSEMEKWMTGEFEQVDDMCIIGVRV